MKRAMILLIVILLATACNPTPTPVGLSSGPRAWIDAPRDGSQRQPGPLEVVSHTSDPLRIVQVELSVNGAVVRTDLNPDSQRTLVTMKQQWTPAGPGNYTLMVRGQNSMGIWGDYAKAVVTIVGGGTVQGTVYSDLNGNGLPNDPGDAPLDGVLVTLSRCASKTTTTVNGKFQFTDLPAGDCLIEVSKSGWKFSGTHPAEMGYPVKVTSDPAKPIAFSILMTPLTTPMPTPTPPPSVTALPPVTIAFSADPLRLVSGQCTTIRWQVTNASQVFLDNTSVAASGSKQDCPIQTVTHTLRVVTLDNQTTQRSLTITVVPPTITPTRTPTAPPPVRGCSGMPNITTPFTASPASIYSGGSSTLSWGAVTNADSVEIDHGIGGVGTPGSITVSPKQTTTYTLIARCGANTKTQQATVTVMPRGVIPIIPPPASTPTIGSPSVSASTFYAASGCTANPMQVTISVTASDPDGISQVSLRYQLRNKNTSAVTAPATVNMSRSGNVWSATLSGNTLVNTYGNSYLPAWLQFSFVATDSKGSTASSQTYGNMVTLLSYNCVK